MKNLVEKMKIELMDDEFKYLYEVYQMVKNREELSFQFSH